MPKNLLQDMVIEKRRRAGQKEPVKESKPAPKKDFASSPIKNHKDAPRYTLWIVAAASLFFLFFAILHLLGKAVIVVNPRVQDLVLNKSLSASKNGDSDALAFDLVVVEGTETKAVQGGELEDVSIAAKSTAVIYNSFSRGEDFPVSA